MYRCFFISNLLICAIYAWNLEQYGIDDTYFVSSIAVFNTRTFLALPRSVPCNNKTSPTIVEVNWNSDNVFSSTSFLNGRYKITELQAWGRCDHIQDAISLKIEFRKLKLWILDKGNDQCSPKIVSYSLFYNDIVDTINFKNVSSTFLNCLEIEQGNIDHESRAFIGNAGDNFIIVISLKDLHWSKLKLLDPRHQCTSISADYLSISKTDSTLFFTGKNDTKLYSIDLETISDQLKRKPSEKENTHILVANVTCRGEKLGISSALETDYKSGISYFMRNFFAIVRWTTGLPMIAENHNVLGQSYERLPYVSQLFTGPHHGLWALVNPLSEEECIDKLDNINGTTILKVKERAVQILRYNKLIKEIKTEEL